MSPRARKHLDPESKRFEIRFAIRLRERLDKLGIGPSEFLDRLQSVGISVTIEAVKKWLNGGAVPRPQDIERMAPIFRLRDYRQIFPPPVDTP